MGGGGRSRIILESVRDSQNRIVRWLKIPTPLVHTSISYDQASWAAEMLMYTFLQVCLTFF